MNKKKDLNTSPTLAFTMSLFIPGSGQFYNKQYMKTFLAVLLFIVGIFSMKYTIWIVLTIWILIITDAVYTAISYKRRRKEKMKNIVL